MKITQEQMRILSGFRSERITGVDNAFVQSIKGALIDGKENQLATLFKGAQNADDDRKDIVASYIVLSPENVVLGFYSLRCGELFRQVDLQKMELCAKAWEAFTKLYSNPTMPSKDSIPLIAAIMEARNAGITSPNEWESFYHKKVSYLNDKKAWSGSNIEQVSEVLPGVELKYLGVNEDAKNLWSSYGLPRRMGETLFWHCVVNKIEEMCKLVGCHYLYLFAADDKPDGNLVAYYNTILHFDKESDLNANKPHFDFKCRFMCQEIETLRRNKVYFFDHFDSKNK